MTVLEAYLASLTDRLTPDVARWIVDFRPDDLTQQRLDYLRYAANDGKLSESERTEYEEFVETLDFVGVLKQHARAKLDQSKV